MTEEELKALQKAVRKKKRIATEMASEVHDLVEDRLWSDYENLKDLSQRTYQACLEWDQANKALLEAEAVASA